MLSAKGLYSHQPYRVLEEPMNKHFKDTLYYLRRAAEHAELGVREKIDRGETRVRKLTGREVQPEGRVDRIRTEFTGLEKQAEERARESVGTARTSVAKFRGRSEEPGDR